MARPSIEISHYINTTTSASKVRSNAIKSIKQAGLLYTIDPPDQHQSPSYLLTTPQSRQSYTNSSSGAILLVPLIQSQHSPISVEAMASNLNNSVQDPASAKHTDPLEGPPTVGMPLRLLTGIQEFPPEYIEKRPRLIDIYHPLGFDSTKDCSRLRCMDAIMTILWYYDPEVLTHFAGLDNWSVTYNRFAGVEGRLDIEIRCSNNSVELCLYEKKIDDNGVAVRCEKLFPYIRVCYQCDGNPLVFKEYKTWFGPIIDGDPWLHPHCDPPEVVAVRDRSIARYLLLNKPWEDKPGVQQKCTIDQWSRDSNRDSIHESYEMPCPSLKRKPNIYDSVRWSNGEGVVEELDYYGYPSRVDS